MPLLFVAKAAGHSLHMNDCSYVHINYEGAPKFCQVIFVAICKRRGGALIDVGGIHVHGHMLDERTIVLDARVNLLSMQVGFA